MFNEKKKTTYYLCGLNKSTACALLKPKLFIAKVSSANKTNLTNWWFIHTSSCRTLHFSPRNAFDLPLFCFGSH